MNLLRTQQAKKKWLLNLFKYSHKHMNESNLFKKISSYI
jgi:hypothetical protein